MRKIVQISSIPDTSESYGALTALCDDGSVWQMPLNCSSWEQLTPIPQDDSNAND